jgi:Domain of unknown function (DUF1844)
MPDKKKDSGFTVTDRRLFTEEGELRKEAQEETKPSPAAGVSPGAASSTSPEKKEPASEVAEFPPSSQATAERMPPPPSAAEQKAQADAYHASSKDLDSQVELGGGSAKDFEMTFERFLASLYMTAMLQLGLMHQQGEQPRVDIIGARQTIDTLALLGEKTKGNLTPSEQNFLQNSLYELRMAYLEVTNAFARPPQPGVATGTGGR